MVRPLPGTAGDHLFDVLRRIEADAFNLRAETAFGDRLRAYLKWANQAAAGLNRVIVPEDVTRLVITRRYWMLHTVDPSAQLTHRHLLDLEIEERIQAFEQEVAAYQQARRRWADVSGVLVVPDTNVFLHHRELFNTVDWPIVTEARMSDVVLLLPLIVIDELDRAKRGPQRSRARQSLTIIEGLFRSSVDDLARIAEATPSTGCVRCMLFREEPGHLRLPIANDEIIDQARAIHDFTERPVKIASFDTHMHFRARFAGLDALELDESQEATP